MEKLDKSKWYVVGVSGGADSMALLDKLRKEGFQLIVAHMNYLKRDSAIRDELIVRDYCKKYQLICEVKQQLEVCVGNFQAFARTKRYEFYKELCVKYQASGVFVAHHLDDLLETYLIQKQRNSKCDYYGMKEEVEILGCKVYRILLDQEKKQLEKYCEEYHIDYGIDESNLSDDYTRNKIRHEIIEKMSYSEKCKMKQTIDQLNQDKAIQDKEITTFLKTWNHQYETLKKQKNAIDILEKWIFQYTNKHYSGKEIEMIYNMCKDTSFQRSLDDNYEIEFAYGILYIYDKKDISYQYTIHDLNELDTPYFKLKKTGKVIEGITIDQEELPLLIRPYQEGDTIKLRIGTKKINRFFIDRKIPKHLRKKYPVVLNKNQEVIFVCGIGCEIKHFSNNPSIFVVQ